MISPSESAGKKMSGFGTDGVPVRLLGETVREVSRLEFYPVDRLEVVAEIEQENETAELLKEEVVALDGQMQAQEEQIAARIESARAEARAEARLESENEFAERMVAARSAILRACDEFRQERARYFAGVEAEVVKLVLAIAARVLHREVNLDPLLLAGVVRVALEKVAEDSTIVLRVPAGVVEMWKESFVGGPGSSLQIVEDERLGAGECVLETTVGRVGLGVKAQLEEIERGFFDLMQQRPA